MNGTKDHDSKIFTAHPFKQVEIYCNTADAPVNASDGIGDVIISVSMKSPYLPHSTGCYDMFDKAGAAKLAAPGGNLKKHYLFTSTFLITRCWLFSKSTV